MTLIDGIGIGVVHLGNGLGASVPLGDLAVDLEERGFESLFLGEHTHIPDDRSSPFPPGGEIADSHLRFVDPFVGLMLAAARTQRLRVGTAVCVPVHHDPIVLAKTIASLDALSGGRFVFGVGLGWNAAETANHRASFPERRDELRERIEAMQRLWTDDSASYDGRYVRFTPSLSLPRPAQQPHPPILLGCAPGPKAFAEVVGWADGWSPLKTSRRDLPARLAELDEAWDRAGRGPDRPRLQVPLRQPDAAAVAAVRALGAERVTFSMEPMDRDDARRHLDAIVSALRDVDG